MAYTTKVLSGRTYWYKDGKRVAVAKVPANVKSGKKPSGKKPSGKKPSGKKPKSIDIVKKACEGATREELDRALSEALTKQELCHLVYQIPEIGTPEMKNKFVRYMNKIKEEN